MIYSILLQLTHFPPFLLLVLLLFLSACRSGARVMVGMEEAQYPLMLPAELMVPDSRAHKLLVTYCQGWQLIPFPEVFSRHSGTCVIVGDRNMNSISYPIKVGDCFRLGSVGVVVSELKLEDMEEERLDAKTLEFLKDEALAFDTSEELAALATDEIEGKQSLDHSRHSEEDDKTVPNYQSGLTNGEKYICYMCYETHNTHEDPLIAPCECKGDTRFLHVQCLQKWYHSSAQGSRAQVIRTTGNGAPACKICGTAYKTNFRRPDGRRASILEMENNGPYLSLVVVTHHDTNPGLFNTKFRLNFGRRANAPAHLSDEELNTIVIGRSSSCAMVLDYRTVSTVHAKISYSNGKFILTDNRSSNGTMVYLQHPFPLPFSQPIKVRMGRTTLTMQAKRSWTAALRSYMVPSARSRNASVSDSAAVADMRDPVDMSTPSPYFVHNLLSSLPTSASEKNERSEPVAEHDFLNARSYTIRTLNDPSAEGVEFDHDLFNLDGVSNSPSPLSGVTNMSTITQTMQNNLHTVHTVNHSLMALNSRMYGSYPPPTGIAFQSVSSIPEGSSASGNDVSSAHSALYDSGAMDGMEAAHAGRSAFHMLPEQLYGIPDEAHVPQIIGMETNGMAHGSARADSRHGRYSPEKGANLFHGTSSLPLEELEETHSCFPVLEPSKEMVTCTLTAPAAAVVDSNSASHSAKMSGSEVEEGITDSVSER